MGCLFPMFLLLAGLVMQTLGQSYVTTECLERCLCPKQQNTTATFSDGFTGNCTCLVCTPLSRAGQPRHFLTTINIPAGTLEQCRVYILEATCLLGQKFATCTCGTPPTAVVCPDPSDCPSSSKKGLLGLLGLLGLIPLLLILLLLLCCCIRRKRASHDVMFATFDPNSAPIGHPV
jgi:hypothetical protein